MEKRWVKKEHDQQIAEQLQNDLKIHPVLCQLLVQRGIKNFEESKNFFRPALEQLHDPFLMKDMDKAVERIEESITKKEKILIYGDYDVDGTTAVATVFSFFKKTLSPHPHPHPLGEGTPLSFGRGAGGEGNLDYYIPDRYKEGYGISKAGIDWAKENGFSLIIALDCGIKSIDKVLYAKEKNIDFIICDHHLPGNEIPPAVAVLDPKRKDCNYPFKELSGCGIGFKLIEAYSQKNNIAFDEVKQYLDLVAISIASDIVPITDENRIMAYYGLKQINENPRHGIKAMIELSGLKKEIVINDIVYVIGPRINAAGRMDDARKAVKLLISEEDLAGDHAEVLHKHNSERRETDIAITEEALAMIDGSEVLQRKKTTVVFQPHWHKGVIGIVASRLIEKYYRPTIVLTESNGMATGSARSVHGFDLYEAINNCSDLLEQFGGHQFAAGLSLRMENLEKFQLRFEEIVSETIDENSLTPQLMIDAEIELKDINPKFYSIINQFAPFGPGNMRPIFLTKNVFDTGYSKVVKDIHLKVSIQKNNAKMNGIGFDLGEKYNRIFNGNPFDICYVLEENEWNGEKRLQMNVKDIK